MSFVSAAALAGSLLLALTTQTDAIYVKSEAGVPPEYCTVFTHMVKSGGSTIKQKLSTAARKDGSPKPLLCKQKGGSDKACLDAASTATVLTGPNIEKFRYPLHEMGRQCEFFTMMRHPIDRAISAFFYCPEDHDIQNRPPEWCGYSRHPTPATERFTTFVQEVWGNIAFRQMSAGRSCSPGIRCSQQQPRRDSVVAPDGDTLKEVEGILRTYSALGVMEYWDLSMQLFDARVKSPVRSWQEKRHANPGSGSPLRNEVYRWAHGSLEIHAILSTDLLLYNYTLSLFKLQTNETLGTTWA